MPSLDLSDALSEPMFQATFAIRRRPEFVNNRGRSTVNEQLIPKVRGVITPTSPNDLKRLEDEDFGTRTITIYTRTPIYQACQVGQQTYKPDIIVWEGDNYIVKMVEPYTQYGRGFVQAIATSMDYIDQAPTDGE